MKNKDPQLLMDEKKLGETLESITEKILSEFGADPQLVLIGIRTRGVPLAERMREIMKEKKGIEPPVGILDITLYRDDLSTLAKNPIVRPTTLPFDLDDKKIILIDDVIYTGRTIRAALDQLADFGRPALVRLAVLIDRGWREIPIHPDFAGFQIETEKTQIVQVRMKEIDGDEKVMLLSPGA